MPTTTTTTSDNPFGMSMTDIINAALAIYGIKQGQKPPKFYIAPETPQEQWKTDASKGLYNTASGYTNQFLQGLGNMNPDWKMPSSEVGNPAFMGGIKLPTFDPSKIPALGTTPTGTTTPDPTKPGTTTSDPFGGPASGLGGNPNINFPTSGNTGGVDWSDPTVQSVANWITAHPNIAKGGAVAVGAALGPAAAAVAGLILNWIGGHGGTPTLPQGTPNTFSNGNPITPGSLTPGLTPGQNPESYGYVPGVGWVHYQPGNLGPSPTPSLNTPYDQWFGKPPETSTPFNPQYAGNAGPGYYDPKGGASTIAGLLGGQMSGDGRWPGGGYAF